MSPLAASARRARLLGLEPLEVRALLHADPVSAGPPDLSHDAHNLDAALGVDSPVAAANPLAVSPNALLPDLTPWASQSHGFMYDWTVQGDELRLTTAMANIGTGPLELRGGAVNERDPVDVFVVGGSVDEFDGNPRVEGRYRNVRITSYDYGQLIARAKRLTFGLYDELRDTAPFLRRHREEIAADQRAAVERAADEAAAAHAQAAGDHVRHVADDAPVRHETYADAPRRGEIEGHDAVAVLPLAIDRNAEVGVVHLEWGEHLVAHVGVDAATVDGLHDGADHVRDVDWLQAILPVARHRRQRQRCQRLEERHGMITRAVDDRRP